MSGMNLQADAINGVAGGSLKETERPASGIFRIADARGFEKTIIINQPRFFRRTGIFEQYARTHARG